MPTATLQSRDPELEQVTRLMVAVLDEQQRAVLDEALGDPEQLVDLLCGLVRPPHADLSEAVAAFRSSLSAVEG